MIRTGKCLMGVRGSTRTELWTLCRRATWPKAIPQRAQAPSSPEVRFHSIHEEDKRRRSGPTTDNPYLIAEQGSTEAWKWARMSVTQHRCKALALNSNSYLMPWRTCKEEVEIWEQVLGDSMQWADERQWIIDSQSMIRAGGRM